MRCLLVPLVLGVVCGCSSSSKNTISGNGGNSGQAGSDASSQGGTAGGGAGADAGAPDGAAGAAGTAGVGGGSFTKVVFNTIGIYEGDFTEVGGGADGLVAADAICQDNGNDVAPEKAWRAFVSTSSVDAMDRVPAYGEWILPSGVLAFASKAAWASGPAVPINEDQYGAENGSVPWTGTNSFGKKYLQRMCEDWTDKGLKEGEIGDSLAVDSTWVMWSFDTCNHAHSLYCFEE